MAFQRSVLGVENFENGYLELFLLVISLPETMKVCKKQTTKKYSSICLQKTLGMGLPDV